MKKSRTADMNGSDLPTASHASSAWPISTPARDRLGADADDVSGLPLQAVLRLMEEQGQIGYWWHDLATDRITVSSGLARISGTPVSVPRTRQSMLGMIHPQDRPFQADQTELIDNGQPLRREFRIVRPDGTIRWVSSRIDVVLGHEGRPLRFIGIVTDITERREAQRAIEFNHGRRTALIEATSALTWIADLSGRVADHSAWCVLTGMESEHCDGEGWVDAVHPNDRDRVRTAYRAAIAKGTTYDIDYRILTRGGEYRWFNARSAPVRDPVGTIREWQGVLLPIVGEDRGDAGEGDAQHLPTLTGSQIRGARGLLDWSLAQLASASGVSVSTIKRMEDGNEGSTRASKSEAVRRALQTGGIIFRVIDGTTWIGR